MNKIITLSFIFILSSCLITTHGQNRTSSGFSIVMAADGTNKEKIEWRRNVQDALYMFSNWENGQWKIDRKVENRFDNYGNLVKGFAFNVDATGNWIENMNFTSEYNRSGTVKSITVMQRNHVQEWVVALAKTFEYNANNEIILIHEIDQSDEVHSYTIEYQYDDRGNCVVQTIFDVNENVWHTKIEHEYDAENNFISTVHYQWFDSWIKRNKAESEYDINKNKILDINSTYFSFRDVFENEQKNVFVYDDNNRITESSLYSWNLVRRDWDTGRKSEYSYDEFGNVSTLNRFRDNNFRRDWILHETITYHNEYSDNFKNDDAQKTVLVYLDEGSGSFINISGAAGATITIVDAGGFIHHVRNNARDFETVSTLTLPTIIFVNVKTDDGWITRKILR